MKPYGKNIFVHDSWGQMDSNHEKTGPKTLLNILFELKALKLGTKFDFAVFLTQRIQKF